LSAGIALGHFLQVENAWLAKVNRMMAGLMEYTTNTVCGVTFVRNDKSTIPGCNIKLLPVT